MELLIFGTVNLLALTIFIVASAVPAVIAWKIGKSLDVRLGVSWIKWGFPLLLVTVVLTWVAASYRVFEQACNIASGPRVLSRPKVLPRGIRIYGNKTSFTSASFSWDAAIEKGYFLFVDTDYGARRCADQKSKQLDARIEISAQCSRYSQYSSDLSVHILPAQRAEHWWSPPIYTAEIQIRENSSDKVVATATDIVFGGGLVGTYLRAIKGDQDFSRLSCGYASRDIGPWRPTLASRVRVRQYEQADLALLQLALLDQQNKTIEPTR